MQILFVFLALVPASGHYHCQKQTGGDCKLFGCKGWRGVTQCVNGECVCTHDHCATAGVCYKHCDKDTGGSCKVFGCGSSRGDTECVNGHCMCHGSSHCAEEGKCKRLVHEDYHCQKETGGSCKAFGCKGWRGVTQCVNGECVCTHDRCATAGVCYKPCDKDTGGSCKVFGCGSSRGYTACVNGHCVCRGSHHCAEEGKCKRYLDQPWSTELVESNITAPMGFVFAAAPEPTEEETASLNSSAVAACVVAATLATALAAFVARRSRSIMVPDSLLG